MQICCSTSTPTEGGVKSFEMRTELIMNEVSDVHSSVDMLDQVREKW